MPPHCLRLRPRSRLCPPAAAAAATATATAAEPRPRPVRLRLRLILATALDDPNPNDAEWEGEMLSFAQCDTTAYSIPAGGESEFMPACYKPLYLGSSSAASPSDESVV